MSIQQNVNQLLTMAGTAAMLSPQLRDRAEHRKTMSKLQKEQKLFAQEGEAAVKKFEQETANLQKNAAYQIIEMGPAQLQEKLKGMSPEEQEAFLAEGRKGMQDIQATVGAHKEFLKQREEKGLELAKRIFEADPTEESASRYIGLMENQSREKYMKQQALKRMQDKGLSKVEQKSDFDKFRESLSADDTFHSLSPAAQKIAYEQYTKGGK